MKSFLMYLSHFFRLSQTQCCRFLLINPRRCRFSNRIEVSPISDYKLAALNRTEVKHRFT